MDAQSIIADARRKIVAGDPEGARDLLLDAGYVRQLNTPATAASASRCPLQEVGRYLAYTGHQINVLVTAALPPCGPSKLD